MSTVPAKMPRAEVLVLRELYERRGRVVPIDHLIAVAGQGRAVTRRQERRRVAALVHFLRVRFGSDAIVGVPGGDETGEGTKRARRCLKGYMLREREVRTSNTPTAQ